MEVQQHIISSFCDNVCDATYSNESECQNNYATLEQPTTSATFHKYFKKNNPTKSNINFV
jgi:hypothetical protein